MARVKVTVKHVTAALKEHHNRILEALALLYRALDRPDPDPDDVLKLIRFAQHFVDACHHGVEEYILFSGAVRRGFPYHGGPIQVMACEHGEGRLLVRMMEEAHAAWRAGDASALRDLAEYARMYADHLSQHIEKENNVLFPMMEAHVREVEASRAVEDFEREHGHERWLAVLEELKAKYG